MRTSRPTIARSTVAATAAVAVVAALGLAGCDGLPTRADDQSADTSRSGAAAAAFPTWHQGFNHGTSGWITDETSGAVGWCGDISQFDRGSGPVFPSAGRGYAAVEWGGCNDFWSRFFDASGPYSPGAGFSKGWPQSGFVFELDIYLDPDWESVSEGTAFVHTASLCIQDDGRCVYTNFAFRYFAVPVVVGEETLNVAGHPLGDEGWYTFRHVFDSEGGSLSVDFQLARNGVTLFTEPITTTFLTGEATSSLEVDDLGSGYLWFAAIADGLRLPIDEHRVRPGEGPRRTIGR